MSRLIDAIQSPCPVVDARIASLITITATAEIPLEVNTSLFQVFRAIADALEAEGQFPGNTCINCVFSGSDRFTIEIEPPAVAINFRVAFYPIERMRPYFGTKNCMRFSPKSYAI